MTKKSFNQEQLEFYEACLPKAKAEFAQAKNWYDAVRAQIRHYKTAVEQEAEKPGVIHFPIITSTPDPILDRANRENGEAA